MFSWRSIVNLCVQLFTALLTQFDRRAKIRYEDIARYWSRNDSSCDLTHHGEHATSSSASSASSSSAAVKPEDGAASNYSPRIATMHDVRCDELNLQIGAKYLYCHQSCCEHYLYLTDIRLRHPVADPASDDSFPAVKFMKKVRRRRCCVCDALMAKFVVYGDRLLDQSPAFLCQ